MKKIILVAIAVLTLSPVFAQTKDNWKDHWKFGVIGGVNLTRVENYGGGLFAYFDAVPAWQAGVVAQYKWGKFLNYAIQPELKYSKSSTMIETVWGPQVGDIHLESIDLPINFQFGVQLSPIFRPFIFAGVNFGYIAKVTGEYTEFDIGDEENFDLPDNNFSKFNFGLNTGIGFDLWKFQFQANYNWGLTTIDKPNVFFEKLYKQGWEFSLAIMF